MSSRAASLRLAMLTLALLATAACGGDDTTSADPDSGALPDAAPLDAGPLDAGDVEAFMCPDLDGDRHADAACGGDDCDDADSSRYPGATEVCDLDDEDCDDATYGADADGDGFESALCCNGPSHCGADCDDALSTVNPSAAEVCNGGLDDDCNGLADLADGVCTPCPAGFTGFDGSCTDVDECATATTCGGARTGCANDEGSYVCECLLGYVAPARGGICTEVDECALAATCGLARTGCANSAGSYTCSCESGYTAPSAGGACADVDECTTAATCGSERAGCVNLPGSYQCACNPGYAAPLAGGTCADLDECSLGMADCDADPLASCGNTPGSYSCACPTGFAGDGHGAGGCLLTDPQLGQLEPSVGLLSPSFDSAAMAYSLTLPQGATSFTLRPVAPYPGHVTVTIEGVVVASGVASPPIAFVDFAPRTVAVTVTTETGAARTYSVVVRRGTLYLKASNSNPMNYFGGAVAVSSDGSTFAVGSVRESSSATGVGGDQLDNSAYQSGAVYVFRKTGSSWAQEAYVKASNTGGSDWFGGALALSTDGSTLAVGATGESSSAAGVDGDQANDAMRNAGAVYVFRRTGTTWAQEAYLKSSTPHSYDLFGGALALSGDGATLAVGALAESSSATGVGGVQTDTSAPGSGAVYLFGRSGTIWSQHAYVKASNTGAYDCFGAAVALSADGAVLAVGAHLEGSSATNVGVSSADNSAMYAGAVYVFRLAAGTWTEEAYVKASNTGAGDRVGGALALSGDGATLAVGATYEASGATGVGGNSLENSLLQAGAAYVFRWSVVGWAPEAYLKASNTGMSDQFGDALALSSDGATLVVGALGEDSSATGLGGDEASNAASEAGAAYVFRRAGAAWVQAHYVKASNAGASDYYGASVALSGDGATLLVGAQQESSSATGIDGDQTNDATPGAGAAYLY